MTGHAYQVVFIRSFWLEALVGGYWKLEPSSVSFYIVLKFNWNIITITQVAAMEVFSSRGRALSLYRNIISLSRTWKASSHEQTQVERQYIYNEARRLFKANKNVCWLNLNDHLLLKPVFFKKKYENYPDVHVYIVTSCSVSPWF